MLDKVKFLWEAKPVYLIYWVSQACNFSCDHCFNFEENKKKTLELDLEEVRKISRGFGHLKYLTLAGGEPFIRKDLAELAEIFIHQNGLHHLNVVTNGWFTEPAFQFSQRLVEAYPSLSLTMNISMDGFEAEHERIRRKKGSFNRCVETVRRLKEIRSPHFEVGVNSVYNGANSATIEAFGNWVIESLSVPFTINLVRGKEIQNEALRAVDIDHYLGVAKRLHNRNVKLRGVKGLGFEGLVNGVQMTVLDIVETSVKEQRMTVPCQAGKKGVVLTADGDVLLCELLGTRLGNLREHGYEITSVLGLGESAAAISDVKKSRCHCTWECFQGLNTVFAPKLYPKVMKRALLGMGEAR